MRRRCGVLSSSFAVLTIARALVEPRNQDRTRLGTPPQRHLSALQMTFVSICKRSLPSYVAPVPISGTSVRRAPLLLANSLLVPFQERDVNARRLPRLQRTPESRLRIQEGHDFGVPYAAMRATRNPALRATIEEGTKRLDGGRLSGDRCCRAAGGALNRATVRRLGDGPAARRIVDAALASRFSSYHQ
jgi:hypothetical protein